jgi:phage tail sheath protein FI
MPVTPTFPGIYIQELPSAVHTITAAPTNIAVFIGYTHPLKTSLANFGTPVQIFGFADYQRQFGGFLRSRAYTLGGAAHWVTPANVVFGDPTSSFGDMAEAVNQFFLNGGTEAYVVGLLPQTDLSRGPPSSPTIVGSVISLPLGSPPATPVITFTAREITDADYVMTLTVIPVPSAGQGSPPQADTTADVIITYGPAPGAQQGIGAPPGTVTETYRRVNLTHGDANYAETRIGTAANPVSALVTVTVNTPGASFPALPQTEFHNTTLPPPEPHTHSFFSAPDFTAVMEQNTALDKLAIFNLMVIPGVTNSLVLSTAQAFCEAKRAFLIVDPPITDSADGSVPGFPNTILISVNNGVIPTSKNGAVYFPYLQSPDPLTGQSTNSVTGFVNEVPPSGTVAGIFAATDLSRGVWKAPAGFQATTKNTTGVVERGRMTDQRQGVLNPIGVDCLRDFPNIGTAVFGARTLVTLTDEQWRYVPVRRMALFLEQTLYANLGWVLFEPNAEPLWSAIRMSITSFMLGLFRQGAFAGTTPSQAFLVQCDSQTTTPQDVNNGVVNILVGFAPLKPAEFVIIMITQLAGQTQTS